MPRDFGPDARASRARDLWILIGVVFLVLGARLVDLQLVHGASFRTQSEENRIRGEILRAERGRIFDRNGVLLADNYPSYRLAFDPRDRAFRKQPDSLRAVVSTLAGILERDPEKLLREVERSRSRWGTPLLLDRNLSFSQLSRIEERMERLPGVEVEPESMRRYPRGKLAAHALGHLGEISESELEERREDGYRMGDLVGRTGVERQYEIVLRGRDGMAYVEVDALGRRTHQFPDLPATPAVPGLDVVLTLDARLQEVAERALEAIPRHGYPFPSELPAWGAADSAEHTASAALVALDPQTGEILALASRPAFDPNMFVRGLTAVEWAEVSGAAHPLLNRAIQSSYPPGSIFKVATSLVALEAGVITPHRTFSGCTGGYFFGNRVFRCWKPAGHGVLSLRDALARSCDVYYYQVGIAMGLDRLGRSLAELGIGEATGVDLPQERAGLIPTPEWYLRHYGKGGVGPGAALNISIGQGEVLLTPLQMARFTAAVSNGGRIVRPHILRRVQSVGGEVERDAVAEDWRAGTLPVSAEHIAELVAAMEQVVMDNSGTGGRARVGTYRIAGKTGTAQNPHGDDHAVFICFATVEEPSIAIAVIAEESGHGGSVSAPVAHWVLEAFLTGTTPGEDLAGAALVVEGD